MSFSEIKEGQRVHDIWYPWAYGVVVKKLKTRVRVKFGPELITYDTAHATRFLKEV